MTIVKLLQCVACNLSTASGAPWFSPGYLLRSRLCLLDVGGVNQAPLCVIDCTIILQTSTMARYLCKEIPAIPHIGFPIVVAVPYSGPDHFENRLIRAAGVFVDRCTY